MNTPRQESNPKQIGSLTRNYLQVNGLLNKLPGQEQQPSPTEQAFVHPILTPEDFKNSLENYNRHIKKYNLEVYMESAGIRKYNREVRRARTGASVPMEQRVKEEIWKETNKNLPPEEYNAAVEAYNDRNGLQLRKKPLRQPVKPESEKYFLAFLYQYNAQLFRRKASRISLEVHVPGELPQFDLYPNKIIEAERNGVRILPVSVETVRGHRERLEEAGVFLNHRFRGANRAVKMTFNPEILSITDNGSPKNTPSENQRVRKERTNKVPHNNVSSREHSLEKDKIRDEGVAPDKKSGSTHHNCTEESTKAPKRQGGKFSDAPNDQTGNYRKKLNRAAAKNELSEVLSGQIQEKKDLARSLSSGKFENYRRISEKVATKEAFYGALHQDDFKELAIQDIFRFSASIFSALDVHPGSWMNAYKIWMTEKFTSPNGFTLNKQNILSQWQRYITILKEIKNFAKIHPEWQPHYPSLYFDPARKFKENNSFEYASQNFRLGDKEPKSAKQRKIDAGKSLRHKTDVKKAQEQIRRMISGKISLDQLFDYVQQNCNKKVNQNLNYLVKKEFDAVTRQMEETNEF